jgi:hypothetical protein
VSRTKPTADEALDEAEAVIAEGLDELSDRAALLYGPGANGPGSFVETLRVAFGLAHPAGPHHPAPGFASVVYPQK